MEAVSRRQEIHSLALQACKTHPSRVDAALAAGDGPDDQEGLGPRRDHVGERRVGRLERQVLLAGEEPQERASTEGDVVADRPAQHRIAGLEGVEDGALGRGAVDAQLHLADDPGQGPEVGREYDSDHGSVWTSTERTAGRSRTIGDQESPASADAYTWPPVVPKYTPHESSESTAMALRSTLT